MTFNPNLLPGDTIDNTQLMNTFLCGQQGGMRRSLRTNSLILISDHTKNLYEDSWQGNVLHYVGMGTEGDQDIDFQQNKTLANSANTGINLFLFEVFKPGQYIFIGAVELADTPYQIMQPDAKGNMRQVWVFPLKAKQNQLLAKIPTILIEQKQERKRRKAHELTDERLKELAKASPSISGKRQTTTDTYERNPYVAEYTKRRANGICQLCNSPAPFLDAERNPYLENHHIIWLSAGGQDTIENTVALCPNCHRKMHVVKDQQDVEILTRIATSE